MRSGKSAARVPAARVRVRRAREADLPAIDKLYGELHGGDYAEYAPSPSRFRAAFRAIARSRDHHLLVAEVNGEVAGTLHVLIFRHLGHGLRPVAIIENVVVGSQFRSQGIGKRMIEAAGRIARANRCYKMSLTSNRARRRAHRFYERIGWQRTHHGFTLHYR